METSSASSGESHGVCVIHFEGKDGELRELTTETLNRILERRKEWLSLPSSYKAFTEVAKKSFEFIHETDDLNPENIIAFILLVIEVLQTKVNLIEPKLR